MSDESWLGYTGAVTGVIGAITGIAGAVMGYLGYRSAKETKALDLRLELRRAEINLRNIVNDLPATIERGTRSRKALAAATDNIGSSRQKLFDDESKKDLATAEEMKVAMPDADVDYMSLDYPMLEERLTTIHAQTQSATALQQKYVARLAEDDKERERLIAQHSASRNER